MGPLRLQSLTTIGGSFGPSNGRSLPSLEGLEALREIGGDFILDGSPFGDLCPVRGLTRVGGTLRVRECPELPALSLPALTEVGSMELAWNERLKTIQMGALDRINGSATFENSMLLDFDALESVTKIGGTVKIRLNDDLTKMREGFPNLTLSKGDMRLHGNRSLPAIEAENLAAQVTVRGELDVLDNGY